MVEKRCRFLHESLQKKKYPKVKFFSQIKIEDSKFYHPKILLNKMSILELAFYLSS